MQNFTCIINILHQQSVLLHVCSIVAVKQYNYDPFQLLVLWILHVLHCICCDLRNCVINKVQLFLCLLRFVFSSSSEVSNWQYSLLLNVSIRESSVFMTWNRLPEKLAADISNIEILWTRSHNEDTLLKSCVSTNTDHYVLQDLVPGCIYTVWMGISHKDGTVTFTNRMHFVSLHHYSK